MVLIPEECITRWTMDGGYYGSPPDGRLEFMLPSDYAARVAAFRDNLTKPASPSPGKPAGRIFTLDDE